MTTNLHAEIKANLLPAIGVKPIPEQNAVLYDYHYAYPALFEGQYDVLRWCRGIIFDATTDEILSRPYKKFFNLGESPESKWENLDFSKPHAILEKLDGSMVRTWVHGDKLHFGTRAGVTDVARQAEAWAQAHPNYLRFSGECYAFGYTPVYEWCSRQNRVVLDHPVERLVLTALVRNDDGYVKRYDYMKILAESSGIEVVKAYDFDMGDKDAFVAYVKGLTDMEGFVIRFEDGLMVKIKADEYMSLHGTLDIMRSEKTIFETIFSGLIDDVKSRLKPQDLERLSDFESRVFQAQEKVLAEIATFMDAHKGEDRKTFASYAVKSRLRAVLFQVFSGGDARETLTQFLGKADPDGVRQLLDDQTLVWGNRF